MLKKIFLLTSVLLLLHSAKATVVCLDCNVGKCVCEVVDCDSGIVDIFEEGCSLMPDYEMTFRYSFEWKPKRSGTYYVLVLCDNGETSGCEEIEVEEETTTTSRVSTSTTRMTTSTIYWEEEGEEEEWEEEGLDLVTLVLFLLLVILIGIGIFYMFMKRKGKKTWEELYRKWGRYRVV